jgi:thiamine biosynthesis protein ThiI
LKPYKNRVSKQKGRIFVEVEESCPESHIHHALSTTFGIVAYSQAIKCDKNLEAILESAISIMDKSKRPSTIKTFKVETVRSDKSFYLKSYDISREVGHSILTAHRELTVDVHNPDCVVKVEIRDAAYIHPYEVAGQGGLPVGTAGEAMLMLSGGIDSPVAGWYMAKRGVHQHAVYFHAYPYTSNEAKEKVISLARILSTYLEGITLHIISFTDVQLEIKQRGREEEQTLLMRAAMMKITEKLAIKNNCQAIVTGEALSQVASQTLESLAFTDSISPLIVLRPLIGLDKEEIIQVSRKIGTFETSILPYEDCCTLFSPKHPLVRPNKEKMYESLSFVQLDSAIEEACLTEEIINL